MSKSKKKKKKYELGRLHDKAAWLIAEYASERGREGDHPDLIGIALCSAIMQAIYDQIRKNGDDFDPVVAAKAAIAKLRERDARSHAVH